MNNKKQNKIIAVSLFSGCGGLDIGAHMAGVKVVSSIDFDNDSISTLKLNPQFKNTTIFHDDITNFNSEKFKDILKKETYNKLILIGGPPCQPFSKAGYWIGNKRRKGSNDPRNMIGEYLNLLKKINPDGFLLENVESLLHPTNKHNVDLIINTAASYGYQTRLIRANALDYGVPQKRRRIFILGSKEKFKTQEPTKTHCDPAIAKVCGLKPYESVKKFIQKFDRKIYAEKEESVKGGTYERELYKVPAGKNYFAIPEKFKPGTRFWNFLLKLDQNKPSWTIAAQPGPWVGPFHWTSRRLRVPEIAAIQTFPANYKFFGSRRSVQRQIGNAVPPVLAKKMIGFLAENL